ncbi:MAG TPA: T9SS type A sorting domain-containing protein, partial [Chitinophagaceae bacterium]|nr:T9SS type A sorting domain-containing protein [Chitinophagaceae bacterium]
GLQHDATSASLDNVFKFTGNTNSSISGITLPLFANVEIALTGTSKIILQRSINISQGLSFQSGLLDLNNNNIDLGTTGTVSGESETTRITGVNGGYIQIVNTLNAPSSVNPGNLGAIFTSTQNLGSTTIRRGHQSQTIAAAGGSSILRNYDISPSNNSSLNATIRFSYFDAELNSLDETSLVFWRSPDKITWSEQGYTSRNTTTNYVEKTGIDAFSSWTLSSVSTPLPVTFILFNARCENGNVILTWKTAQEFNSSHFDIERSTDGNHWTAIGTQPAAGNSNTERSYISVDNGPLPGAIYRIAEHDIDGHVKYTSLIRSDCDAKNDWKAWPNPVTETLWLNINSDAESKITIKIIDSKGALVGSQQNYLLRGNNLLNVDMKKIAAGTYQVIANWNNGQMQKTVKIVKL